MNVVIYARYSSDKQTEQSIEGQLRVCYEYAEKMNYTVIGEFIDRAMSGKTDHRPQFLKMIEESTKKNFTAVLVYKLDRFARNKYDSVVYKHKLKQNGVKVISATESISDSPEGALVEGLLEIVAEMYSTDLRQKVLRGQRENLLKKITIGGRPPFGYKVIDKKFVIDEEKSNIVKFIFEKYAESVPKKKLIELLNDKGYKTQQGTAFSINSLYHILTNKRYLGIYQRDEFDIENFCPQLISEELFNEVQKQLNKNKRNPARAKSKEEYLLSGKAFCGICGNSLVGVSGTGKHRTYYYYACSEKWKKHTCVKSNESKDKLELQIVQITKNLLNNNKNINYISERIIKEITNNDIANEIRLKTKQVNKISTEINRAFDLFYESDSKEIRNKLDNKIKDLEIFKEDLQLEINKLTLVNEIKVNKEEIIQMLKKFTTGDVNDTAYQKCIINYFVDEVHVFDTHIEIFYNILENHSLKA